MTSRDSCLAGQTDQHRVVFTAFQGETVALLAMTVFQVPVGQRSSFLQHQAGICRQVSRPPYNIYTLRLVIAAPFLITLIWSEHLQSYGWRFEPRKKPQSPAPRTTSANTCTVIRVHFQPHDRQESSGTGSHSHSPSCNPLCVINRTVKRGSIEIGLDLAALHFTGNHWVKSKQKNQCFTLLQVFSDSKLLQDWFELNQLTHVPLIKSRCHNEVLYLLPMLQYTKFMTRICEV